MTNIIDSNGQMYRTPGFGTTAGAVILGSFVHNAATQSYNVVGRTIIRKMKNIAENCDSVSIRKGVQAVFDNSNLKSNGVALLDIKPLSFSSIAIPNFFNPTNKISSGIYKEAANKKLYEGILNSFPKFIRESGFIKIISNFIVGIIGSGNNAAYFPKAKLIGVNIDKFGASAFHEIGHAINHNKSVFWKGMQCLRLPAKISGIAVGLTALFKRKKMNDERPVGTFDKVTTFIKNNVGKLVLASSVPIVAEELMATYRGNKMAKKMLSPVMFLKVKKLNKFGAISYISSAFVGALAAYAASKTRDKIARPKLVKS